MDQGPGYDHFSTYQALLENRPVMALRDLLEFKLAPTPLPLDQVESVESICTRFCTGGMSLGALSREAHEVLAVAMNRIGGKSNSGEGGEDPARFQVLNDVDGEGTFRLVPQHRRPAQRRHRLFRDQADRFRPLRCHGRIPAQRQAAGDQGGPGRQAR